MTAERSSTLNDLFLFSAIGLAIMTAVAAATAWVLSGRALRPLRDVTATASRASRETLGDRLNVPVHAGELKELAETFNGMLDRLESSFSAQERFVADASHELRTPMTALGAVVDVTVAKSNVTAAQLGRMAVDVHSLLDESEALIASLLLLARSDAGVMSCECVDLAGLVNDALDLRTDGLRLERKLEPATISADRVLVQRAVGNLVENAVNHNDCRGWISASTFMTDSEAGLTIENTGALIAPSEVAALFRPFYRLEGRVGSGHGLGLAIVRSVAQAHGGRCDAHARIEGGMVISMALPIKLDKQILDCPKPGAGETFGSPQEP